MKDMSMYTQENATTVRTARDTYDANRQAKDDAKQTAFEKMAKGQIAKFSRRMKRTGNYTLSLRTIKKINGGRPVYFTLVDAPDSDGKKRHEEQERLDNGFSYYGYGKWDEFLKIATDAGLKFTYRWKLDPKKKKWVVNGFYLHFKR